MIEVELNRKSLDDWRAGISRTFRRNLEVAQGEIRRDWQIELYRQSASSGDGVWAQLSGTARSGKKHTGYKQEKEQHFPGKPILQRTGVMLAGYVDGIQFDTTRTRVAVIMPYPTEARTRAMAHQGVIGQPKGMPIRAFDVEKFEQIAFDKFNEAMSKSANE